MLKRTVFALVLAAGPVLAQDASSVVASVNGQDITLGQMIAARQDLQAQSPTDLPDTALWDLILDQLIRQAVVASKGEGDLAAGDKARLALLQRNYHAEVALEQIAEPEPTEEEINAVYARIFGAAEPAREYHAAHILLETEEAAKAIKEQLDEGVDFGKLAEERSTGPSGPNKGDLGWFTADRMVEPFAKAVEAMEPGQVSDPVQTEFGWHVIKLMDSRMQEAPKLDEVRDQLAAQVRRERVDAAIQSMVAEAKIEKTEGLKPELLQSDALLDVK